MLPRLVLFYSDCNLIMVETLATEDYVTIGIYFCVVLAVGLWVSCRVENDIYTIDHLLFPTMLYREGHLKHCRYVFSEIVRLSE